MKTLILLLLILCGGTIGAAQQTCQLDLQNAPALFNLRLGMSPVEARAAIGNALKIKIKKRGDKTFFQEFAKRNAPAPLENVNAIYLRFFDLRLYQIEIFYRDQNQWPTLDAFADDLRLKLNLTALEPVKGKRQLNCGDFSVVADKVLNPRAVLTDELTRQKVSDSQAAKKQKDKN